MEVRRDNNELLKGKDLGLRRKVPRASQWPDTEMEGLCVRGSPCCHTVLVKKKKKCFPETAYLITREVLKRGSIFHKRITLLKKSKLNNGQDPAHDPVSLVPFQRKYIVNLEIKAIEVQEKPWMFNRPCPLGGRGEQIGLKKTKPIQVFPQVVLVSFLPTCPLWMPYFPCKVFSAPCEVRG